MLNLCVCSMSNLALWFDRFLLFQLIRKVFDLILKLQDLVLLLFQQGKSITAYLPIIASHTINKLNLIVASITRRKVNH